MRAPWRKKKPDPAAEAHVAELQQAEQSVERIRVRAEPLVDALQERLRRNHWGSTVEAIIRRET